MDSSRLGLRGALFLYRDLTRSQQARYSSSSIIQFTMITEEDSMKKRAFFPYLYALATIAATFLVGQLILWLGVK